MVELLQRKIGSECYFHCHHAVTAVAAFPLALGAAAATIIQSVTSRYYGKIGKMNE